MVTSTHARRPVIRTCLSLTASLAVLVGLSAAPAGAEVSFGLISTFIETSSTPTSVTALDGVMLVRLSNTGQFVGTLTGSAQDEVLAVVQVDGSAIFSGTGTCMCTVGGRTGLVRFRVFGTQSPSGSRNGLIVFQGTGPLAGLVGFGTFAGSPASLPITGTLVGLEAAG